MPSSVVETALLLFSCARENSFKTAVGLRGYNKCIWDKEKYCYSWLNASTTQHC